MSVSANDFLASAESFLSGSREIDFRNCASRAYYAAFHLGVDVSVYYPSSLQASGGAHEQLIKRLSDAPSGMPGSKAARVAGVLLGQMRVTRIKADYEIRGTFGHADAQVMLETFRKFSEKVEDLRKKNANSQNEQVASTPPTDGSKGEQAAPRGDGGEAGG